MNAVVTPTTGAIHFKSLVRKCAGSVQNRCWSEARCFRKGETSRFSGSTPGCNQVRLSSNGLTEGDDGAAPRTETVVSFESGDADCTWLLAFTAPKNTKAQQKNGFLRIEVTA